VSWNRCQTLLVVALIAGVVFQPHTSDARVTSTGHPVCPPNLASLIVAAGRRGDAGRTVTCLGWTARDFIVGDAAADVLVEEAPPRPGSPCMREHFYTVRFVDDTNPTSAVFRFAGGATSGVLPSSPNLASMASVADAYVTDAQLGTEERAQRGRSLACMLDSTYHFTCPATGQLDEFCITWLRRSLIGVLG
jgi:hypothetical protein